MAAVASLGGLIVRLVGFEDYFWFEALAIGIIAFTVVMAIIVWTDREVRKAGDALNEALEKHRRDGIAKSLFDSEWGMFGRKYGSGYLPILRFF
jgi:hypothetical protein